MFIRSVDALSDGDIDSILERAHGHRTGRATVAGRRSTVVGLVFLEASLRTRFGFGSAAARLGFSAIEVSEPRHSAISMPESVEDTLRTVCGYSDVTVARVGIELSRPSGVSTPLISGGDRGPRGEHPTQALIDVFALNRLSTPLCEQTVAVCGDLGMRTVRSLFGLLTRTPPHRLVLITDPALTSAVELPTALAEVSEHRSLNQLEDVHVLYVAGIPHGALDEPGRTRLRVTPERLARLPRDAMVLSPMPIIDEIDSAAMADPRMRMFEQSDDGLFVRMAMLEFALDHNTS